MAEVLSTASATLNPILSNTVGLVWQFRGFVDPWTKASQRIELAAGIEKAKGPAVRRSLTETWEQAEARRRREVDTAVNAAWSEQDRDQLAQGVSPSQLSLSGVFSSPGASGLVTAVKWGVGLTSAALLLFFSFKAYQALKGGK